MAVTSPILVNFLKKQTVSASLLERLKISYRPFICPFEDLLQLIQPGARVLDVGCGSGQFLTLVAEFTKAIRLAGLEIKPNLVKQAITLLEPYKEHCQVNVQTFDGINFPPFLVDFDTVFLIDVLHHVPKKDQETFLKNIYQGLNLGTTLILKDIDAGNPWVYFNKLHDLILSREIGNELSIAQATKLVTDIGFQVQKSYKKRLLGYPHFTLILKK